MKKPQDSQPEIAALKEEVKKTRIAYQMASEMSQFKAGFLARISHELRSPLNSLIGLHQLILSDLCEDPAEEREFIAQAHASALKLVGLMDEILNVARTEYGSNRLEIQPVQLAQVLAQVYDLTHLIAANRNHRLTIEPIDPEIYVLSDPRWLRQVLVNLVDTPLKYSEPMNVRVSVRIEPESMMARILIEDERPASAWSEPINLLEPTCEISDSKEENFNLSPGLSLTMNLTLLELMKGSLEILTVPTSESNLTRIQCSIPLCDKEVID